MATTLDVPEKKGPAVGDILFYLVLLSLFAIGSIFAFAKKDGHDFYVNGVFSFEALGILVATGLTLALYSFLYKDNAFFKAAENLYVGVGLGYELVLVWYSSIKPDLYKPLIRYAVRYDLWQEGAIKGQPDFWLLVPLFLGFLLLSRFIPKLSWMSRWAFAFYVGFGAGASIPNVIASNVLQQLKYTLVPIPFDARIQPAVNTVVILLGVVSVLLYFFFSIEHRGPVGVVSKIGVVFLMVCFGASFGYTVMGRMALLVQRVDFLLLEWLKLKLETPLGVPRLMKKPEAAS